jgi:maltooligosyltrehalose trehalohydrolase
MKGNLGAAYLGEGRCRFCVWAPLAARLDVHIVAPEERTIPLEKQERGYYQATVDGIRPGSRYFYRLDGGKERPDPASCCQPQGVHGPSEIVDPDFDWDGDQWSRIPLQDYILYEIHVGTFTPDGTFDAIISRLDSLKDLGVTAIELMPVAQFPGNRNWGYDGAFPFAVQNSYGGPDGLKRLVRACHRHELAVVLDVVYNHLGPEGNYFADFAPYFTERHKTPWGAAVNFDGPDSDEVRRYFIENALYWIREFHMDALRLDAVHAIFDFSARTFLEDLADAVHQGVEHPNNRGYLIAESDQNDVRLVYPRIRGGYELDALWNDDFHHALHTLLTPERCGYYQDFGRLGQLIKAWREGFAYSGEYSPFRRRRHGTSSRDVPGRRLVVFAQNHDQVGNRMLGERLSVLVPFDVLKLAAGVVLLSPFIPLLFMGEEYGETAPFTYFISHSDPDLIQAVRRGRKEEFAAFAWQGNVPDPQSDSTYLQCRINYGLRSAGQHRVLCDYYRELIRLRKHLVSQELLSKEKMEITESQKGMAFSVHYRHGVKEAAAICNFGEVAIPMTLPPRFKRWRRLMDSSEPRWSVSGTTEGEAEDAEPPDTTVVQVEAKAFVLIAKQD